MDSELYDQLLFDYYGDLLTKKQQQIMQFYYEDNLTLSEIAEKTRTSRQAVHDNLKRSHRTLEKYEEHLGLIESGNEREEILSQAIGLLKEICYQEKPLESSDRRLNEILSLLEYLEKKE